MAERKSTSALVLSAAVLAAIAGYEGYRSTAYIPVPGDVPTIGHGTTRYEDGKPVKMGDKVTPERARILLQHDASAFARAVQRCAPVPMYQHEFDAFTSLAYNIGEGAFCRSTLVRELNKANYLGACREILRWDYANGQRLPGLTKRRAAEQKLCLEGLSWNGVLPASESTGAPLPALGVIAARAAGQAV